MSRKEPNPPPPEDAKRPTPPPAPPRKRAETIEQPPEQKKVPRLRHGMTLKIGNESFKVIRPGKKLNVILKYMGG